MAAAHSKFAGDLGVCLSTGGPGASHLVTGRFDAKCRKSEWHPPEGVANWSEKPLATLMLDLTPARLGV